MNCNYGGCLSQNINSRSLKHDDIIINLFSRKLLPGVGKKRVFENLKKTLNKNCSFDEKNEKIFIASYS